jgi:hypothetical protein
MIYQFVKYINQNRFLKLEPILNKFLTNKKFVFIIKSNYKTYNIIYDSIII